jgi:hypothetical protein
VKGRLDGSCHLIDDKLLRRLGVFGGGETRKNRARYERGFFMDLLEVETGLEELAGDDADGGDGAGVA